MICISNLKKSYSIIFLEFFNKENKYEIYSYFTSLKSILRHIQFNNFMCFLIIIF